MRLPTTLVVSALCVAGCQHIELRNHTLRTASTISDLQYQQVLNNLAMFCANPNSLPYFSVAGTGVTQITNVVNANGTFNWDKQFFNGKALSFYFDKAATMFGAMQTSNEQWNTGSIVNPDELLLMRCVYQKTVNAGDGKCDCERKVATFFQKKPCYLEAMQPGWYCVGHKHDVPKCAAYVGCWGDTYVWVMPDQLDYLTRLTLAILDLATAAPPNGVLVIPNPVQDQIKALTQRVRDLEDMVRYYPKPAAGTPDPQELVDLRDRLRTTTQKLVRLLALAGKTREELATMHAAATAEVQGEIQLFLQPPPELPEQLLSPRKNFYNPIQPAGVPVTVP